MKHNHFPPRESLVRHLYLQELAQREADEEIKAAQREKAALDLEELAEDKIAQKEVEDYD